jgi:hypothetical protein
MRRMIDMVSSWCPPADHDAARRERPYHSRAAEQRNELAPPQLTASDPSPWRDRTQKNIEAVGNQRLSRTLRQFGRARYLLKRQTGDQRHGVQKVVFTLVTSSLLARLIEVPQIRRRLVLLRGH